MLLHIKSEHTVLLFFVNIIRKGMVPTFEMSYEDFVNKLIDYDCLFQSKIEKRRQQMKAKKEAEEAEQVKLREHEQKVVE